MQRGTPLWMDAICGGSTGRGSARGFTLVELGVCIVVALLIALLVAPLLRGKGRTGPHHSKDPTQVRGIHQGLVMWAQNNQDRFPLPSQLDAADDTVLAPAASKDTTSNIMSVLMYNGFFGPEICISPQEVNPQIAQMTTYAYSMPTMANRPAKALWDPTFNADFSAPGGGHFSYAHTLPSGPRLKHWVSTFAADVPIVSNRGPQVTAMTWGTLGEALPTYDAKSNTLRIHGSPKTWEGAVVYADNHVNYEVDLSPPTATFLNRTGKRTTDCLFFDEPEDATGENALLAIWTKSGAAPEQFWTVWD